MNLHIRLEYAQKWLLPKVKKSTDGTVLQKTYINFSVQKSDSSDIRDNDYECEKWEIKSEYKHSK